MRRSFSLSAYGPVVGLGGGSLLLEEEASLMMAEQGSGLWGQQNVIRSHLTVTFPWQHLSVCFSSRPMVCAVSGSGLLSQGQMWVSFHGVGLNARETVVTPTTLGLVLEDWDHHLSPGAYANQATFRTSLRATHGSSLRAPVLLFLGLSSLPSLIIKDPPHTIPTAAEPQPLLSIGPWSKASRHACPAEQSPPGTVPVSRYKTAEPQEPIPTLSLAFYFIPEHFLTKLCLIGSSEIRRFPLGISMCNSVKLTAFAYCFMHF